MFRQLPLIVGIVSIVALTVVHGYMSDRLVSTNVTAEQRAKLLNDIPKKIGEWEGQDLEVTEEIRNTAGAVGCVSRAYKNSRTGEVARLWLIVGHANQITGHTPDICYRGSGFSMRSDNNSLYAFDYQGQTQKADFWTNTFVKEDSRGRQLERVFWAWYNPKPGDPVVWRASSNTGLDFGNSRALFKMYFASQMRDLNETTEASSAAKFGREFLPLIENILAKSDIRSPDDASTSSAQDEAQPAAETAAAN